MIDFTILDTIEPLPDDYRESVKKMDLEAELNSIQKQIDGISVNRMPFDKYDYICIFATAIIEIFTDYFTCDPTNPNSLASKFNDSKNPLGKWCNEHIHEGINHSNNPMDFQGKFDELGNQIIGEGHSGQTISFGGGDHRGLTYDHDLLKFFHALHDYQTGTFHDGGFINGKFVEVATNLNRLGNEFAKSEKPLIDLICHLFADFWSTRGLPIPGWSFLSHAEDRELRQWASKEYHDGFNFRTELLKNVSVAIGEAVIRVYSYVRFRDKDHPGTVYNFNGVEYTTEAYQSKRNLMLLMAHGIAFSFSIGKAVVTENPLFVNTATMLRVIQLTLKVITDEVNLNHRRLTRMAFEQCKARLSQAEYIVVTQENIYYTANYLRLAKHCQEHADIAIATRQSKAEKLLYLQTQYNLIKLDNERLHEKNNSDIEELTKQLGGVEDPQTSLSDLLNDCDNNFEDIDLETLIKE